MLGKPPTHPNALISLNPSEPISVIFRAFALIVSILLGVMIQFGVYGSVISEMKKSIYPSVLATIAIIALGSCRDNTIAPVSATDKITALVTQAESETKKIQSSIDLTAAAISIENLALSADYFVNENHLKSLSSLDTNAQMEPWKKECNSEFLKERGFGRCLTNLNLNAQPILNDEYQLFVDLKSEYKERIASDIDSLQHGNIDNQSFQQKMDQYQQDFIAAFSRQRNANKNLSMLSVNYRKALETIKSTLSESQFKQFYICHQR
jgi:hypothetical protein